MGGLSVELIPALRDNYIYLVRDLETNTTAVVDPAESAPVVEALSRRGWTLDLILNTHHHGDHTGGNADLKSRYGARLIGPAAEKRRIAGMDETVAEGDTVTIGASVGRVLETPGHTSGHIVYHFADSAILFAGDTLFVLGCGRLFEGTPEDMWSSLSKLLPMPDETLVYCGHEYTVANARFAVTVDPLNRALESRAREVEDMRARLEPTIPTTMGQERATNPFLRPDDPVIRHALDMVDAETVAVFAEIRARKDAF
jgi:hydroxyacylglutathione hydrolase